MSLRDVEKVASIIRDAGGRIVGRTRLQKIAYLLTVTGMEEGFSFSYKHYGPYSEGLAAAAGLGNLLGRIHEAEHPTSWGGSYSIYTTDDQAAPDTNQARQQFARAAADADAVELELAATAVLLAAEGYGDAWDETARRKPDKVGEGRLDRAKSLLRVLSRIDVPHQLPNIV